MNRRDFLSLRLEPRGRTLEVSCERLYMRCLDARTSGAAPDAEWREGDLWDGEPPAILDRLTPDELFARIESDLDGASTLRILDGTWLADADLSRRLETIVASFRARGGRVEFSVSST